ncbi:unnamed protein product, partial [Ixodes hexagonus]
EEENLCAEHFQQQLNESKGIYMCRKVGDNYLLECRDGLFGYGNVTTGRLTRWSCTGESNRLKICSARLLGVRTKTPPVPAQEMSTTKAPPTREVTKNVSPAPTQEVCTTQAPSFKYESSNLCFLDPCSSQPCLNGGVCKPGPRQTFTCV